MLHDIQKSNIHTHTRHKDIEKAGLFPIRNTCTLQSDNQGALTKSKSGTYLKSVHIFEELQDLMVT